MSEGISFDICEQDPDPPKNSPNCNGQMPICALWTKCLAFDMMGFDEEDDLLEVTNLEGYIQEALEM
jgi:hypothetical protein